MAKLLLGVVPWHNVAPLTFIISFSEGEPSMSARYLHVISEAEFRIKTPAAVLFIHFLPYWWRVSQFNCISLQYNFADNFG